MDYILEMSLPVYPGSPQTTASYRAPYCSQKVLLESCGVSGRRQKTVAHGLQDSELRGSKASRLV